jgi:threonine dehydrogenase-like Zn-dependent dehydrogenase
MKAVTYHGKRDVRVDTHADPTIEQPTDAIVRITSTAICGSDLHLYEVLGAFIDEGDILGHEPMGIVEAVGSEVEQISVGDRVVIPFNISCGHCWMCDRGLQSQCETTQVREQDKGAALFGYTKLYGQVPGGQAELLRVPQAHYGPIKVPEGPPDERFLYLSDVLPTAWQAVEYAEIPEGGSVAVYGLGPIGQMSCRIAARRGAGRVFGIDRVSERLELARRHGVETLDVREHDDVAAELRERTEGRGPDAVIDAVGMEAHGAPIGKLAQDFAALLPDAIAAKLVEHAGVDRLVVLHQAIDAVRRRRHDLAQRRLRRPARPAAADGPVRQADLATHGPSQRQALDRRPAAARHRRRRPARRRGPRHAPSGARRGRARVRDLPEEAGRRDQDRAEALKRPGLKAWPARAPQVGGRVRRLVTWPGPLRSLDLDQPAGPENASRRPRRGRSEAHRQRTKRPARR